MEERTVIDVEELRILRVECVRCGATITAPLDTLRHPARECPACGAAWLSRTGDEETCVRDLVAALKTAIAVTEHATREQRGFRIRFELPPA
jgi:hypothetical protein